jgi:hypothetical protein
LQNLTHTRSPIAGAIGAGKPSGKGPCSES